MIKKDVKCIAKLGIVYQLILNILILLVLFSLVSVINNFEPTFSKKLLLDSSYLRYYSFYAVIRVIFITPIIEELIYRKFLYKVLERRLSRRLSIMISSAIFAIIHSNFILVFSAFIVGYINCKLYDRFNSLIAPTIFHSMCNTVEVVNINIFKKFYIINILSNSYIISTIIIIIVILIYFIWIFKRQYKNIFDHSEVIKDIE